MTRVLWIDDEADSEAMASRREDMSDAGFDVIPCTTLGEAERALASGAAGWDVVLVDMIMPPPLVFSLDETQGGTTTGLSVIKRIRERLADIPIVVVSVQNVRGMEASLKVLGVTEWVRKPFDTEQLLTAIRRAITRKR